MFEVDIVVTGAGADDDLEAWGGIDHFCGNGFGANDDGVGVGVGGEEAGGVFVFGVEDGVAAVGFEVFTGDGVEGGWDEDFFHGGHFGGVFWG